MVGADRLPFAVTDRFDVRCANARRNQRLLYGTGTVGAVGGGGGGTVEATFAL